MQTDTTAAAPLRERAKLSTRTSSSPKAGEPANAQPAPIGVCNPEPATAGPRPESAVPAATLPTTATTPAAAALDWSSEDESAFQAMAARRKAAGYQRRGKEVGAQLIRVGDIAPNAGTVVAAIVALVAEHHTIGRGKLLDAMATATFPHAKAKPTDRIWCQGYVSGAVRHGFLALASDVSQEAGQ